MLRQYELVDRVSGYDAAADETLLNRAYVYTVSMHGKQKRQSGDPYFSHPIEVAGILTDYKFDTATIVTALLHDTIEDTNATVEELTEKFGAEIAEMVDGVTKLSKVAFKSESSKQAENLRKFLLAMSKDIRVLMVKLADRLHNMRTLHFIPKPEKRKGIAQETLEIYAPLAARIGMQKIREEMEDLAFQQVDPEAYATVVNTLQKYQEESGARVTETAEELKRVLLANGLECEVYGRQKRPYALWAKGKRNGMPIDQVSDIFGFRVIVDEISQCYQVLGILHTNWKFVASRFKDYISTPKTNGYQSIHTSIIGPNKKRIEVQIRTREMHRLAEYGIAAHWMYKEGVLDPAKSQVLQNTFQSLKTFKDVLDQGGTPEEILEHTKLQMFTDQVFCFTPKGDVISLPRGANAIDFAYEVHTDIGDSCVGCKINERYMPLRTVLRSGDEVEIIRSKMEVPPAGWESVVVTGKARSAIRRALRMKQMQDAMAHGRMLIQFEFDRQVEAELRRKKAEEAAGKATNGEATQEKPQEAEQRQERRKITDTLLQRALGKYNFKDVEELCVAVGEGRVPASEVYALVYPNGTAATGLKSGDVPKLGDEFEDEIVNEIEENSQTSAAIKSGHAPDTWIPSVSRSPFRLLYGKGKGMPIELAPETFPLPGERVIGILQPEKGVVIYPVDAPSLAPFYEQSGNFDWIDVRWEVDESDPALYPCRLTMSLMNDVGALSHVASTIADHGSNIIDLVLVGRDSDFYRMTIDIEVQDLAHAHRIMNALRGMASVSNLEKARA